MAAQTKITCACGCGKTRMVRTADVNRGWGKYYDKTHKARHQNSRIGNPATNYLGSGVSRETFMHYANEYGGNPQFDRHGNYEGFTSVEFDNCAHQ